MGVGFIYIYIHGSATADAQLQWLGEKKIWWNHLRIIHGVFYLSFSGLASTKHKKKAYILLFIDTFFGLLSFIHHHLYTIKSPKNVSINNKL